MLFFFFLKMYSWILLSNAFIAISAVELLGPALREKRQLSFGFGLPIVHDIGAVGGIANSFLGGFFGQNQHHGARPIEGHGGDHGGVHRGDQGGDHGHFPIQNNEGCNNNNIGCHHECHFRRGRPKCFCNPGYFLNEDGRTCSDIDECSNQFNRPCQDICTNTEGSFVCGCSNGGAVLPDGSCSSGQFGVGLSCAQNNGGCQQYCRDRRRRGGVRCRCDDGYEIGSDQRSCLDIDECASGFHNCGPLTCVNTVGNYECRLIGTAVAPVIADPCQVNNGGCQHICVNNHGTVLCKCPEEFQLVNGKLCQRVVVLPVNPPSTPSVTPSVAPPTPPATAAIPQQQKDCGSNSKKSLFRRIVGGKPADPKDWPWMAALLRGTENQQQFCGGTLISNIHVLTAAHCVHTFTTNNLRVRLGEYSFATSTDNSPTDFKVTEIRKHEKYDSTTQENDIAILKVEKPATFSEFIAPACLPPPNNNFQDLPGYVIGWGTIYFGGPVSSALQEVIIPAWKQDECIKAYPNNKVTDDMMCCGQKGGGKDSCQGDSGGPFLVQIFPDSRWYVAGIVSWGIECASPNHPGVYTRVNRYLDWIKSNTV